MKLKLALTLLISATLLTANAQLITADKEKVKGGELTIQPITHATLALAYKGKTIYIDPTGGADAFKGLAAPDVILITDIHGDHFDLKTIEVINTAKTTFIAPQEVAAKLPASIDKQKVVILNNGDKNTQGDV
ncbi:MAG: MBL fold metallo-hydrolase, partial [Pedobacter sp.]